MNETKNVFIDDYRSCERTYITLYVYHKRESTQCISEYLGLEPTRKTNKGDRLAANMVADQNGWFFNTRGFVVLKDVRRHLTYLTDQLHGKETEISELKNKGCDIYIMCLWESATGNGGPMLNHELMGSLYKLGLDLDFDIWID